MRAIPLVAASVLVGCGVLPRVPKPAEPPPALARYEAPGLFVEVSCSDGVYCNGEERWVKNACVSANGSTEVRLPCGQNETDPCLIYACIEETRSCSQDPVGVGCAECTAPHCVPHCKNSWECGDDGCGGTCGPPCTGGATCIGGKCIVGDPTPR